MGQRARPCGVEGCRQRCRLQFRVKQYWEEEAKYYAQVGLVFQLKSLVRGGNRPVLVSNLCPEHASELFGYFEKLDRVRTNINEVSPKLWVDKAPNGWSTGPNRKTP